MIELKVVDGRAVNPESDRLEFKRCTNSLTRDFWPTYSAFANTFGGTVFLGVDDATKEIVGVEDPDKVTKQLWDVLNDHDKVSVNIVSPKDISVLDFDGRAVIRVDVPRAERRKRPVYINNNMSSGTYKRNGESDYHCSVSELKQLLRDSSDSSQDSSVLTEVDVAELDPVSISSFRNMMSSNKPYHPWNGKSDEEFLRLIGATAKGEDGEQHPTVAGLLMFGLDYSIMSVFPNYHLDYLEFANDGDRWMYRLTTGSGEFAGNVLTFLGHVSNRLAVVNERGKTIDGMVRMDDTPLMRAERELIVNALVHADYNGPRGVRAEWRPSGFMVRNPGNLRIPLDEMVAGGVSDPRNPHIALMMGLIGMAERAGSGVSEVVSACRGMSIPDPVYTESVDPETVTVRLLMPAVLGRGDMEDMILDIMRADPTVSLDSMSKRLGVERSKMSRMVNVMKDKGMVERIGGTRGHWNVIV